MARVIANFLVGANFATCSAGSSKALSFPADRRQFHALRARASAILIGGATYRAEPYLSTTRPLLVATRDPGAVTNANPTTEFMAAAPSDLVEIALQRFNPPLLIEGGVSFITPLLRARLIDELHLTRSQIQGDSHFFEIDLLAQYRLSEEQLDPNSGGSFQIWVPTSGN